jgi:hypothetical protein
VSHSKFQKIKRKQTDKKSNFCLFKDLQCKLRDPAVASFDANDGYFGGAKTLLQLQSHKRISSCDTEVN